jgi:cytochrome c oxidase subunit II
MKRVGLVALLLVVACQGTVNQSALHPAGPQAHRSARLWWFALAVAAIVYLATLAALGWAMARARHRERLAASLPADSEHRMTRGVAGALVATVAILLLFLGYDLSVGRTMTPVPSAHPVTFRVTGHQWWWEVQYVDTAPAGRFTTANEIHVPVGEPVLFLLDAADVIHSMWVPNLAGKKDLIPGYTSSVWFQADSAGVYRGQCAEFCGLQHARMAMLIVAEPRPAFERWLADQRAPAAAPADSAAARGQAVFLSTPCALCHNVEGTPAGSHVGPDLTHLASRRTIAAGTLPNDRGTLAGWVTNAQAFKPGSAMPPVAVAPADLDALLTYLQSLK